MKPFLFLGTIFALFALGACSSLPRPEKDPVGEALDKEMDTPISDGIVGHALEDAASTFPKTKSQPDRSRTVPASPR